MFMRRQNAAREAEQRFLGSKKASASARTLMQQTAAGVAA